MDMKPPTYDVRITNAQDGVGLSGNGSSQRHIVTFMVGERGPFTLIYDKKDASDTLIQADIARQVSTLKRLDKFNYGG